MSFGKGNAPTPPNPIATAGAQTSTNVSTAVANAFLNNTNQQTPLGSLTYDPTGSYSWTDPSSGSTYNIPRFTATQALSGNEQAIQNETEATKLNLAGLGAQQSSALRGQLGQPLQASAPAAGDPNLISPSGAASGLVKDYGANDFSADRANVEAALYGRINPQLAIEKGQLQQQLADQGLRPGSPAFTAAMDQYSRQANDARLAVTQQAGQEQQRMQVMAAARAAFQNQAQQQQFGQYQQYMNARNQARAQYLQEAYAAQNQPINVISALMSGSQVQQPNFISTPQQQIPTTDIGGLINQNFQQQFANYQQQNQNANQIIGGLFGAAGNIGKGYFMSDRDTKENVHRIGTVFAGTPQPVQEVGGVDHDEIKKLPIYSYNYKDDPASVRHVGPMAQDVEKVDPGAVREIGGIKHVHAGRLMGSILHAT